MTIRVEPSLNKDGHDVFLGQYCTGRFWHTVRDDDGAAVHFESEADAAQAAREEWWAYARSRAA